ncbi:hypothetical protein BDR05DRAFT_987564 [Suillus weaverae]|nr:hypothetical protein BDR05DRAFT_987564 [Suillus weaverae]
MNNDPTKQATERRPSIVSWDNGEVCLRAIRVMTAMPGSEVIPSWHRRIAERTFDFDTSVLNDVPPKTLEPQLLLTSAVGKNILGCSLKLVTTKGSFVVPPAKKSAVVLMRSVIMVRLETNGTMVTRRSVRWWNIADIGEIFKQVVLHRENGRGGGGSRDAHSHCVVVRQRAHATDTLEDDWAVAHVVYE